MSKKPISMIHLHVGEFTSDQLLDYLRIEAEGSRRLYLMRRLVSKYTTCVRRDLLAQYGLE